MKVVFSDKLENMEFLGRRLEEFNGRFSDKQVLYKDQKEFGFYAYEDDKIIGGICGNTDMGNWLYIDMLYMDDKHKGKGIGRALVKEAENFARQHGCVGMHLTTYCWQAKGFYEKLGFEEFGKLNDHPLGAVRHYMKKQF